MGDKYAFDSHSLNSTNESHKNVSALIFVAQINSGKIMYLDIELNATTNISYSLCMFVCQWKIEDSTFVGKTFVDNETLIRWKTENQRRTPILMSIESELINAFVTKLLAFIKLFFFIQTNILLLTFYSVKPPRNNWKSQFILK